MSPKSHRGGAPSIDFPVVARVQDFDPASGGWPERLLFNHRGIVLLVCALITALLAPRAPQLQVNADYEQMIPTQHPYIVNYLAHQRQLQGLGNVVRVVVENPHGSILDPRYLETLRTINDDLYLLPGVDRPFMKSLWTANTRWMAVTEEGIEGGPVIDEGYDGSAPSLERVRANIEQSGEIGQLVAADFRSSIILMPLLERDPETGARLDYGKFAHALEQVRDKYERAGTPLRVVGFAAVVGELIAGLEKMLGFFAITVLITTVVLVAYTRSLGNALLVVASSLTAVLWLLGLLAWLGKVLDPYSILVPFLIFAIGVSHGMQKMNGIAQDIGRGTHKLVAARYTFRRLFTAGLTALLAAASGFAVLAIIRIGVIRELAFAASLGVAVLIFTNLLMLPILLSFVGVSPRAAHHSLHAEPEPATTGPRGTAPAAPRWLTGLAVLTRPVPALIALGAVGALAVLAFGLSRRLKVGDLDPGAPELAADSRYNRDNAYVMAHYAASSDILAVMVKTAQYGCATYQTLAEIDLLEARLRQLPGVRSTSSLAQLAKRFAVGMNEGNLAWYEIPRNQGMLNALTSRAPRELMSYECDLAPLYIYLEDHRADTLARVVAEVESFTAGLNRPRLRRGRASCWRPAMPGSKPPPTMVVERAHRQMLVLVYGAMLILCGFTFRSWRAVACAAAPLALSALFCEALMVLLAESGSRWPPCP